MLAIQLVPNSASNNGECYEIKKEVQTTQGRQSIVMYWYKTKDENLHMEFVHPPEVSDFTIHRTDGILYQSVQELYKCLQFLNTICTLKRDPISHHFKFTSAACNEGTPNNAILVQQASSYCLHFNEFSATQSGFTDIVIAKNDINNKGYYDCFQIAFQKLGKLYEQNQEVMPAKVFTKQRS